MIEAVWEALGIAVLCVCIGTMVTGHLLVAIALAVAWSLGWGRAQ